MEVERKKYWTKTADINYVSDAGLKLIFQVKEPECFNFNVITPQGDTLRQILVVLKKLLSNSTVELKAPKSRYKILKILL